jgi:hypothetical protein
MNTHKKGRLWRASHAGKPFEDLTEKISIKNSWHLARF